SPHAASTGVRPELGQFERMIALWLVPCPTASTVPPLEAAMAPKKLTPAGVLTMVQLLPFQCSVNGPSSWCPTAHTSPAETPATAAGAFLARRGGVGAGRPARGGAPPVLDPGRGARGDPAGRHPRAGAHRPHVGRGQRGDRDDSAEAQVRGGVQGPAGAVPVQ